MTPSALREFIEGWFGAHQKQDAAFFERMLADDVEWTMHGPPQAFPVPTSVYGKAAVLEGLRKVSVALHVVRNVHRDIIVDGDRAAVISDRTVIQRSSGRTLIYRVAAFLEFRDGKLVRYQAFYDTFDMLEQVLGKSLDVPAVYQD